MARQRRSFGKIRKLPSGRYQASYIDPRGTETRYNAPHTFDAKLDAEGWLAGERRLMQLGEWTPPDERTVKQAAAHTTFKAYSDEWLKERDLAPTTRVLYRSLLDLRLLPDLGDEYIVEITPKVVRAWWSARDRSTPTRNRHAYRLLRTILASAVDDHLVAENPCQIPSAGRMGPTKDLTLLSLSEFKAVVDAMPEKYQAPTVVAAWCGLRFGELIELRRKDILRTENGLVLRIRRAAPRVRGRYVVGDPKSRAGVRNVAVPPHVAEILNAHMKQHTGRGPESFIFSTRRAGTRLTASAYGPPFKRAVAAIGRPEVRIHDLRHLGATMAAQAGATTKELMARLGHSSPGMGLRYQHASAARDVEIARRLSDLAGE